MKKWMIASLVTVLILGALCIWQRNNIEALYLALTNDREGVEKMIEDNKKDLEEKIKEYSDVVPRNLTPEEEEMIARGEMSVEEATALLLAETENTDETTAEESSAAEEKAPEKEEAPEVEEEITEKEPVKTEETPSKTETSTKTENPGTATTGKTDSTKKNKAKESEIIKNYTAQFYSMKAYYIGQLNQIEANARSEYSSMSKEQKKNLSKAGFVGKYVGYATGLQSECDAKVSGLLEQMKAELKAVGGDLSIINTVKQAYENEKAARKAYYMNMVK
ncbi:MAG: hypothetical protein IJD97_04475 [Clostridia bacterium]|nr:hypothetical protein [Clostridia bacterium]